MNFTPIESENPESVCDIELIYSQSSCYKTKHACELGSLETLGD